MVKEELCSIHKKMRKNRVKETSKGEIQEAMKKELPSRKRRTIGK